MKIIIIGDLHFPYHNKNALKEVTRAIKAEKPTHIVQIGDLYDQYSFSRFTRKNITLPEAELKAAREESTKMWRNCLSVNSVRMGYQILGNHDLRLIKRAEERLPEAQKLVRRGLMELYKFKGVKTIEDDREILYIDNVAFHHGYLSKIGDHRDVFLKNTVVGHSHIGGVSFRQIHGQTLWELNAGYLADETAEPLMYNPSKSSKWTLGYGLIDQKGPRFIPL